MDPQTISAYDNGSDGFARRQLDITPSRLYDRIRAFFRPGGDTLDVGCGCGRDVAWLRSHGYPAIGVDGSAKMLEQARAAFPGIDFAQDSLPELSAFGSRTFANVLCNAVLMHLPREDLITAVMSLSRLLEPEGRLLLSYRGSRCKGEREADGRLFTSIPQGKLVLLLESAGLRVIDVSDQPDATRPDVSWTVVVAEKGQMDRSRGLERIQSILVQDAKVATYKLALIRAFCDVARTQAHLVVWAKDEVYVPCWSVAVFWLTYYWPLVTAPTFIAQIRGESSEGAHPIAFRETLRDLSAQFGSRGLWAFLRALEDNPKAYTSQIRKIANTIKAGPVTYAGTKRDPVFHFERVAGSSQIESLHSSLGWICVPESIWLDICRFDHWIEDSVVMRWAALSAEMNRGSTLDQFLPYLIAAPGDERDTAEIRAILAESRYPLQCVWTGQNLRQEYHVDHVIPYTVWANNDLWNLLPCSERANMQKSDSLPAHALIRARADCIVDYWHTYRKIFRARFDLQISRALGCLPESSSWETEAISGLQETVQRLSAARGLQLWMPANYG